MLQTTSMPFSPATRRRLILSVTRSSASEASVEEETVEEVSLSSERYVFLSAAEEFVLMREPTRRARATAQPPSVSTGTKPP